MQARGFLNYRLKYCWPKVIHCRCQPKNLNGKLSKKGGANMGSTKNLEGPWLTQAPLRIAIGKGTSKGIWSTEITLHILGCILIFRNKWVKSFTCAVCRSDLLLLSTIYRLPFYSHIAPPAGRISDKKVYQGIRRPIPIPTGFWDPCWNVYSLIV